MGQILHGSCHALAKRVRSKREFSGKIITLSRREILSMKKSRITEEQIASTLRQGELGTTVADLSLDKAMLQEVLSKKGLKPGRWRELVR